MGDFSYTTVPGKIKSLLEKIRQVGVPGKATVIWLKSIGFKSSNDATLLGVLKAIGLTDKSGVPSDTWLQYRGAQYKTILGLAVRNGYAELFAVYPDVWKRENSAIEDIVRTHSASGDQVVRKTVATFRALCDEAKFDADESARSAATAAVVMAPHIADGATGQHARPNASSRFAPNIHIDVQVHISPDATAEQIDQVFTSMAKHLYRDQL